MTSLSDYGIVIEIDKNLSLTNVKKHIVVKDAEWPDAVGMAIQCRTTHPEEAVEIYPVEHGLFTVVREEKHG